MSRSAASLLVALLALTPATQAVCEGGCAPSPSSPANVVTTGQTEDCGHGEAGSANGPGLTATGCGLDVPRILAIQAAPQHLQPAAGTPYPIDPAAAHAGPVVLAAAGTVFSPPPPLVVALRI